MRIVPVGARWDSVSAAVVPVIGVLGVKLERAFVILHELLRWREVYGCPLGNITGSNLVFIAIKISFADNTAVNHVMR